MIDNSNLLPFTQGFCSNISNEVIGPILGSYTIMTVGIQNTKATAIIKVIGGPYLQGLNAYLITASFNANDYGSYSNLTIDIVEQFNGDNVSELINEITKLDANISKIENKVNDVQTLYLSLGSSMTKEECLSIIEKLDAIDKNKFYTINIYDKVETYNYGSCELISIKDSYYRLIQNIITSTGNVQRYIYTLHFDGTYERQKTTYGSLTDILKRLNIIEEKLNQIV